MILIQILYRIFQGLRINSNQIQGCKILIRHQIFSCITLTHHLRIIISTTTLKKEKPIIIHNQNNNNSNNNRIIIIMNNNQTILISPKLHLILVWSLRNIPNNSKYYNNIRNRQLTIEICRQNALFLIKIILPITLN